MTTPTDQRHWHREFLAALDRLSTPEAPVWYDGFASQILYPSLPADHNPYEHSDDFEHDNWHQYDAGARAGRATAALLNRENAP